MPLELNIRQPDFEQQFEHFLHSKREASEDVELAVKAIIDDVRTRGDVALLEYTNTFDRQNLRLEDLKLDRTDFAVPDDQLAALEVAANRIRSFHQRHMPVDDFYFDSEGVGLGARWRPVSAAGLYVPGGTAAYPSSVLMNAIPAKVAGVQRLVMVVPTPDGVINPLVMAAAKLAGVDEIYRVGGAQAVAALAFGTPTIRPVDKIVGPGNAYVANAKRQVFGQVGIDMIAGPSEILVLADRHNDPSWIAADLLSQAEHDVSAQSILITDDQEFADAVSKAITSHLTRLPRAATAQSSWNDFGAIILVEKLEQALPLIDRIAPEHLELAVETPEIWAEKVQHAGAIFLGRYTPEAIGDYVAGPNHVLPTARSARFASGLSVFDFLKRTTLVRCDAESLARIGPAAVTLAQAEGLDAHGLSVSIRLNR